MAPNLATGLAPLEDFRPLPPLPEPEELSFPLTASLDEFSFDSFPLPLPFATAPLW